MGIFKHALLFSSFLAASATDSLRGNPKANGTALHESNMSHRVDIDYALSPQNLTSHLLSGFRAVAKALGMESVFNQSLTRSYSSNETQRVRATGWKSCLCIFDIDRTITGKQGNTWDCSGNKVVGGYDDAYGGGEVTLSHLGQHVWGTWCGKDCHIRAISAHHRSRPNIPVPQNILGCNRGCKARKARRMAQSLGVSKSKVYMFDDKANNIRPFRGTGMNAHQVSCGSREGSHGFCGGTTGELSRSSGVSTC